MTDMSMIDRVVPVERPTAPAAERLSCGHPSTPDGLAAGYAVLVDDEGGETRICYDCARDEDLATVRGMAYGDAPLFAYVKVKPGLRIPDAARCEITTWPGKHLGWGWVGPTSDGGFAGKVRYVEATIDGRQFHGRMYPDAGDYVRLRLKKGSR